MKLLIAFPIFCLSFTVCAKHLDTNLNPSSNFDLSHDQLVTPLPFGGAGEAITINNEQLNGDPEANTGYSKPPYFYTDTKTGAMVFFAPISGSTTPGTKYSRSELTEIKQHQWMLKQPYQSNTLTATVEINELPANNVVTIGQIHDRGDNDTYGNQVLKLPLLKLVYSTNPFVHGQPCGGCVYAEILPTPASSSNHEFNYVIKREIKLNDAFTYSVNLTSSGKLTINVANKTLTYSLNTSDNNNEGWGSQYLLFHAGCYLHQYGPSKTEGARVSFYHYGVIHSAF